ncbi:hypothetical protein HZS_5366 [Henneguya salminicola]|nr:hypothetical protein HZS_5366 [Henneguya salminicola]
MIKIRNKAHLIQFQYKNIMNNNQNIDMTEWIENSHVINYILEGAYGLLGRIRMYIIIKYSKKINHRMGSIDRNRKYHYFHIRVLSVLWKSYKFLSGECCSILDCSIPCPHSFDFSINNQLYGSIEEYTPNSRDKLYRYDHYRFFNSKDLLPKLYNKKIKCKCNIGFQGKYCEKWYCDKNCNQKGICKGPNTCNCYPRYNGKQCDMYLAKKKNMARDNKNKKCYHHNNSITCFCKNFLLTLNYCKRIFCRQKRDSKVNQETITTISYMKLDSSCDCRKNFPGLRCRIFFILSR